MPRQSEEGGEIFHPLSASISVGKGKLRAGEKKKRKYFFKVRFETRFGQNEQKTLLPPPSLQLSALCTPVSMNSK